MNKTILFFVCIIASTLVGFTYSSSEEYNETTSSPTELEINTVESDAADSEISLWENDHYSEYLKVLEQVGPKEDQNATKLVSTEKESKVTVRQDQESKPIIEKAEIVSEEVEKPVAANVPEIKAELAVIDHALFGSLLQKHVNSNGDVNYEGLKKDRAKLDQYLLMLENNPVNFEWSKNERLTYWINAYNAFTIKLILDNYPVKSIQDIAGGKPWDKLFIKLGEVTYSLNNIENKIIRRRFSEPRIHFAVNCAAKSCPPLMNDAFYPETLVGQLESRTKSFIKNTKYNTISSSKAEVSKIFDWYGEDFLGVQDFINRYTDEDISGATISFKEYDWALNKQ